MTSRYRFRCRYRGMNYKGWQRQSDVRSVQQTLEQVLSDVLELNITVHGAGRTDAGVHALGQVAHFDVNDNVELPESRWQPLINDALPPDIAVNDLQQTPADDFHARHSARRRYYGYRFRCQRKLELDSSETYTLSRSAWKLDKARWLTEQFQQGVPTAVFSGRGGSSHEADRWPLRCRIRRRTNNEFWLLVSARSFKYRMVRCLAGCLIRYLKNMRTRSQVHSLLRGEGDTVKPAPPDGCYLIGVEYDLDTGDELVPTGWSRVLSCFE